MSASTAKHGRHDARRLSVREVYGDAYAASEAAKRELASNCPANAFGLYRYALSMQLLGMLVEATGKHRTTTRCPDALVTKLYARGRVDRFTCRTLRAVLGSVPREPSFRHVEAIAAAFHSLRLDAAACK